MLAAYSKIVNQRSLDVDSVLETAGYDSQPAFNKKFKERFGMTPSNALAKKDTSLITPPITWDRISTDSEVGSECLLPDNAQQVKFGVSKEQYAKMIEAEDMQALYEFDDIKAEVAFELAQAWSVPMKAAFEYVDDYSLQLSYDGRDDVATDYKKLKKTITRSPLEQRMCLEFNYSVSDARELIREAKSYGIKLAEMDNETIKVYMKSNLPLKRFSDIYQSFTDLGGGNQDDFIMFAHYINDGESPEDAYQFSVEEDFEYSPVDDIMDDDPGEEVFEKWAEEQTDYYNGHSFFEEIDMDNIGYYDGNDSY